MQTLLKWNVVIFCVLTQTVFAGCTHRSGACSMPSTRAEGYVDVNKGRLYYQKFGQGTPIIVLHGGPGLDKGYLLPQLLQLSSSNQLIFYDQRGSGKSLETELSPEYINMEQFIDDLEVLRKTLGIDNFILMGHSFGGLIAMQYAIKHQDHLSGLILLNSAPADYEGQMAFASEFQNRTKPIQDEIKPLSTFDCFKKLDADQIANGYRTLFSVYLYDPGLVDNLSLNFSVESAQSGFQVGEEMSKTAWMQPGIDLFPKLKTLGIPTFILHGKQDIIPDWTAEQIHAAIPNSEMIMLDQCGHFPYIERPSQFFLEMSRFLKEVNYRLCTSLVLSLKDRNRLKLADRNIPDPLS